MRHLLVALNPYLPLLVAFVAYPLLATILNWWLWWDTPANWDAFADAHPKRASIVRFLRIVHPHLRKLVVLWRDAATARSAVPVKPIEQEVDAPPVEKDAPSP